MKPDLIANSKKLRQHQTQAEQLLWSILRAGKLSGYKFRRQHPIPPFIADFACIAQKIIVELDGGYHDYQGSEILLDRSLLNPKDGESYDIPMRTFSKMFNWL